ncbi:MAG: M3 family oligoendopeptidase [bacterium]|nr:M3 family oligoendopeptidase [bacterium]
MKTSWNLGLLYSGHNDPVIERDMTTIERAYSTFEKKYRGKTDYLENETKLVKALSDFESLFEKLPLTKPLSYFHYCQDLDSSLVIARSKATQLMERFAKNDHKIVFFELSLAKISVNRQKKFLKSKKLKHFIYYLDFIFKRAKYDLSEPEEKILGLKSIPAYQQWVMGTEKILGQTTITFQGKTLPLPEAMGKIADLPINPRRKLHELVMKKLETISDVAESEINAIVTDKKINDELRGFKNPYDATILGYQNNQKSVLALVNAVTKNFPVSHKFYALKAQLLKLPHLEYSDRAVGIGKNVKQIKFEEAVGILREVFGSLDQRFLSILESFLAKGQIDVYPKIGKTGGAYCSGNMNAPTFVLLNYTSTMDQVMTFAHEMGHAIHTEFSKSQTPLYENYSTSTAEVASTLFEAFVFDAVFEKLSKEEKIIALGKRINDDIHTIFRQIACFNFENELHITIRREGGISKDEIRILMNKHMSSYLGPIVHMRKIDGNMFVSWSHIRHFFYVYSYAFGQLISRALYARYKEDKTYLIKIKKFLSAGGSDTPENIFKSIGVDVTKSDFWEKGLKSIEKDIEKLEKLTENM